MIDLTKPIDVRNSTIPEIEKWVAHASNEFKSNRDLEDDGTIDPTDQHLLAIKEMVEDIDRGIRTFNELKDLLRDA